MSDWIEYKAGDRWPIEAAWIDIRLRDGCMYVSELSANWAPYLDRFDIVAYRLAEYKARFKAGDKVRSKRHGAGGWTGLVVNKICKIMGRGYSCYSAGMGTSGWFEDHDLEPDEQPKCDWSYTVIQPKGDGSYATVHVQESAPRIIPPQLLASDIRGMAERKETQPSPEKPLRPNVQDWTRAEWSYSKHLQALWGDS